VKVVCGCVVHEAYCRDRQGRYCGRDDYRRIPCDRIEEDVNPGYQISRTHTRNCRSTAGYAARSHWQAGSGQLPGRTVLPGAPDTAGPDHRPFGSGFAPGDIRMVCVHGIFLFTIVNTQYWVSLFIYPDFVTGFAFKWQLSVLSRQDPAPCIRRESDTTENQGI
jgi:hypothetical protein